MTRDTFVLCAQCEATIGSNTKCDRCQMFRAAEQYIPGLEAPDTISTRYFKLDSEALCAYCCQGQHLKPNRTNFFKAECYCWECGWRIPAYGLQRFAPSLAVLFLSIVMVGGLAMYLYPLPSILVAILVVCALNIYWVMAGRAK